MDRRFVMRRSFSCAPAQGAVLRGDAVTAAGLPAFTVALNPLLAKAYPCYAIPC
jgi:hypothetical protein